MLRSSQSERKQPALMWPLLFSALLMAACVVAGEFIIPLPAVVNLKEINFGSGPHSDSPGDLVEVVEQTMDTAAAQIEPVPPVAEEKVMDQPEVIPAEPISEVKPTAIEETNEPTLPLPTLEPPVAQSAQVEEVAVPPRPLKPKVPTTARAPVSKAPPSSSAKSIGSRPATGPKSSPGIASYGSGSGLGRAGGIGDFVRTPSPAYDNVAQDRGYQGSGMFTIVYENGQIMNVVTHRSTGVSYLDANTIAHVKSRWKVKPGTSGTAVLPITWKLN